ncbi:hypothetical protein ACFOLJ_17960 [Rugamonas sp. CCM 8940]|nr:hypothetical protein [Rugamonas sp. CCM 8940]MBJ7314045.1 hypothetical protein [Rugamonas sp. CCM 8940]
MTDALRQEEDRLFSALNDFSELVRSVACDGLDAPDIYKLLDGIDDFWDQRTLAGIMAGGGKKTSKPSVHNAIGALKPALLQYRSRLH